MDYFTAEDVRRLATVSRAGPVLSLYLDVDGRRYPRRRDYQVEFHRLVKRLREQRASAGADHVDLALIESEVDKPIDRSSVRGLAVFACPGDGWLHRLDLAVPVRSYLSVNSSPHVGQLSAAIEHNRRFGLLVVDRQRARLVVFDLGVVVHQTDDFDQLPRHDDERGDRVRQKLQDHTDEMAQLHLRRSAQALLEQHKQHQMDHVILAGTDQAIAEVDRLLHPYLAERVSARTRLAVGASNDEVNSMILEVEDQVRRHREQRLVTRLTEALSGNGPTLVGGKEVTGAAAARTIPIGAGAGMATAGLASVASALNDHRVETLVLSEGFSAPGWRCHRCGTISPVGPSCPSCRGSGARGPLDPGLTPGQPTVEHLQAESGGNAGGDDLMTKVDDVVEEAVELAMAQSARVATVTGSPDLDVLGRIAALLRF